MKESCRFVEASGARTGERSRGRFGHSVTSAVLVFVVALVAAAVVFVGRQVSAAASQTFGCGVVTRVVAQALASQRVAVAAGDTSNGRCQLHLTWETINKTYLGLD